MDTWNLISLAIIALVASGVAFFLRRQLFPSWKDLYQAFADGDFALAFFLHRQFQRQVLSGKQRYDRFVQEMNTSRLAEYQNPKRPAFEVGRENNRRQRMTEMLEDESFIREHFKDTAFQYKDWEKMIDIWNQRPVHSEMVTIPEAPDKTRKNSLAIRDICAEDTPQYLYTNLHQWIYISSNRKGPRIAYLYIALSKHHVLRDPQLKRFLECLANTYTDLKLPGESAVRHAFSDINNEYRTSNNRTEDNRIIEGIYCELTAHSSQSSQP